MRQFLAIVFILIFAFQVIPVKRIGKLLNQGQNTEEVQDDDLSSSCPDGKIMKYADDQIVNHYSFDVVASRIGFNNKVSAFIHRSESLPSVHVAEMLSPPPDRC